MSHWMAVKCEIKCSVDVMRRALLRLFPNWTEFMTVDPQGTLKIVNSYDRSDKAGGTFHISVKGGGSRGAGNAAPYLPWADAGLRREADGTWTVVCDPHSSSSWVRNLSGVVGAQVEQLRTIAQAQQNGNQIVHQETEDDGTTITDVAIEI